MLPESISKPYNNIFIRILRVMGCICLFLVLTNGSEKLFLPSSIHTIIIALAFLQSIQKLVIMIIKLIFGLYTLMFNRKIFEVRNSLLNWLESSLGDLDSKFTMKVLNKQYKLSIEILYKDINGYVLVKNIQYSSLDYNIFRVNLKKVNK